MNQGSLLYVLDTSALLTLIEDEAGAEQVQELLEKAKHSEVILVVAFNCCLTERALPTRRRRPYEGT